MSDINPAELTPTETHADNVRSIIDIRRENLPVDQRTEADRFIRNFEYGMLVLMERSEGNPDLMLAMDGFLRAFQMRAGFGHSDEHLSPNRQKDLTEFFTAAGNRLGGTLPDGGQLTGWAILPIDESRTY